MPISCLVDECGPWLHHHFCPARSFILPPLPEDFMLRSHVSAVTVVLAVTLTNTFVLAQTKPRARDLGVPFDGTPGTLNAITDVKGVEVGETTLISGEGRLQVGVGPGRTGVTAILPRGKNLLDPVFAGWFNLNGSGEMTGTAFVEDSGF